MPQIPSAEDLPLRGKRVLVVEDEFLILLDIQSILETAGAAAIITASQLDDALQAFAKSESSGVAFDAAVLDLKLEKDSSAPIAERLAAAGVPFIFLTGAPTDVTTARQFGSAPIVGKPFDSVSLLAALKLTMTKKR
jgi:DNA-binding response OmpR family regulator